MRQFKVNNCRSLISHTKKGGHNAAWTSEDGRQHPNPPFWQKRHGDTNLSGSRFLNIKSINNIFKLKHILALMINNLYTEV
jgi:hypothetical protein